MISRIRRARRRRSRSVPLVAWLEDQVAGAGIHAPRRRAARPSAPRSRSCIRPPGVCRCRGAARAWGGHRMLDERDPHRTDSAPSIMKRTPMLPRKPAFAVVRPEHARGRCVDLHLPTSYLNGQCVRRKDPDASATGCQIRLPWRTVNVGETEIRAEAAGGEARGDPTGASPRPRSSCTAPSARRPPRSVRSRGARECSGPRCTATFPTRRRSSPPARRIGARSTRHRIRPRGCERPSRGAGFAWDCASSTPGTARPSRRRRASCATSSSSPATTRPPLEGGLGAYLEGRPRDPDWTSFAGAAGAASASMPPHASPPISTSGGRLSSLATPMPHAWLQA